MLFGYLMILLAATFWGGSAVSAKSLFRHIGADALLLSQARVTFSWILVFAFALLTNRDALRIRLRDMWHFALLGTIGMAMANFGLYFSFQQGMDTAVADLIQFTSPVIVALWMWSRGFESMDAGKIIALALSVVGCGLALGAFHASWSATTLGLLSVTGSALCYAFLIIWGKHLSRRYSTLTYLHYGLLWAAIFWAFVRPPWVFAARIASPSVFPWLVLFAVCSILVPYLCFFTGLRRVPASRAAIVSTWEPVFITVCAWAVHGEALSASQLLGIGLVVGAICIVEALPKGERQVEDCSAGDEHSRPAEIATQ